MDKPDLKIANHYPFQLTGFGEVDPLPTLARTLTLLAATGVWHCLSAGTALGIHRDQRFIPHDTDLDIAVTFDLADDTYETAKDLVTRFSRANMPLVRSIITGERPAQLVFSDIAHGGVLIDVEFYYTGITPGAFVHYKPEGFITIPEHQVKPVAFRGLTAPLPHPIAEYLTARYGDWQTPTTEKGAWQAYTRALTPWNR